MEAILLRLDQGDIRERETTVYRLKNAFAQNVADALNNWLTTRRAAEQEAEVTISPFEQIDREVIIVPELASNSLIVSATPRYYQQVSELIDQLDERPPMVMIQVLIAEVRLNDTDEFGVELGLQDSLLFDRSLLGDLTTITPRRTTQAAGGATTTTDTQTIVNAPGQPGFNFNNQYRRWATTSARPPWPRRPTSATQGLSNFSLGRVNNDLGFGGFVFSASSNSVSVLLRALQEKRRLEVLSRPQIMALDGQQGIVQVGQQVPRITAIVAHPVRPGQLDRLRAGRHHPACPPADQPRRPGRHADRSRRNRKSAPKPKAFRSRSRPAARYSAPRESTIPRRLLPSAP